MHWMKCITYWPTPTGKHGILSNCQVETTRIFHRFPKQILITAYCVTFPNANTQPLRLQINIHWLTGSPEAHLIYWASPSLSQFNSSSKSCDFLWNVLSPGKHRPLTNNNLTKCPVRNKTIGRSNRPSILLRSIRGE